MRVLFATKRRPCRSVPFKCSPSTVSAIDYCVLMVRVWTVHLFIHPPVCHGVGQLETNQ